MRFEESPAYIKMIEDGYRIRKEQRQPDYLRRQLALRNALASYGWYLIPEPEEGEQEAWVHDSDVETSINGYLLDDSVVFDPDGDYVKIDRKQFLSTYSFVAAIRVEFDKLVASWYPE